MNLHFEKKFRFFRYLWAWRFGLNNLTNHGNPNVVNNNIDSPSFRTMGGPAPSLQRAAEVLEEEINETRNSCLSLGTGLLSAQQTT
jgi:hypothetical protein